MEAARAYGMPATLRFRRILFPQLMRYALPGLNNLWLVVIKDSSLISVVGYYELLFAGKQAAASTRNYLFFYSVTALCFLVLTDHIDDWQQLARAALQTRPAASLRDLA